MVYEEILSTLTNPKGQIRKEQRDALGRMKNIGSLDDKGKELAVIALRHDAWGNLSRTTVPNRNQIDLEYDRLGRKIRLTDPDLGEIKAGPISHAAQDRGQ